MAKIATAIENYLVASNLREESQLKERKFYVSDMGKCLRMRWLKRKGVSTELTPYVYWIFAMGNMIHDYGYKALEAQGLLLQTEETIGTEHWSGRFDGKVKLEKPTIFDFKSAGQYAIKKAIAGADNEENISQILTYVMIYGKDHKDIGDSGVIVYMNKEPNDLVPIVAFDREYHLTNTRAKVLQDEMDKMVDFWITDTIPPCTCPAWMKNYNSYLPFCLMAEKDILKHTKLINNGYKIISTKQSIIHIGIDSKGVNKREEVFHL